jgi:tetrahydromethanopterin S-methyltransferase subunit G
MPKEELISQGGGEGVNKKRLTELKQEQEEKISEYRETRGTPPSVAEIYKDPNYSTYLITVLKREGQEEIAQKLIEKRDLEKSELEKIEEYRIEIKNAIDKSKKLIEVLKPKGRIETIASCSENFSQLVGMIGKEKVVYFLEKHFIEIYLEKGKENFDKLEEQIETLVVNEKKFDKLYENLMEIARSYEVLPENVEEALLKSGQGQNQELREIILSNKGWLERTKRNLFNLLGIDRMSQKEIREIQEKLQSIEKAEEYLKALNQASQQLGEMIGRAVFETEIGMRYLNIYIRGEEKSILSGGTSFQKAGEVLQEFSEESIKDEYTEFKESNGIKYNRQLTDEHKSRFEAQIREKVKKRSGGGLVGLVNYLFDKFINPKIESILP